MSRDELLVYVSVDTIAITQMETIVGNIWVEKNNECFPSRHWDDLIVSVLRDWLSGVSQMVFSRKSEVNLYFMDGPYHILMRRASEHTWKSSFVDRRIAMNPVVNESLIGLTSFISSLLNGVTNVLYECNRRGWRNDELLKLSMESSAFKQRLMNDSRFMDTGLNS